MQVFEIICCMFAIISINCICYTFTYIHMYISIVSSLCFFLHRYLNALVSHIHQYSACGTTSDQGFQLHRLHCCWQTVRSWYCGTEIWWYHRQDGNTKHVAKEFRISTYQPINWCNGGIFSSSSSWAWVASLACFFHSNSWNLVYQSWQFKACQREWYGKLASLWLAEPGPAQDVLRQSEQVLILSWIYVPLKKS